MNALEEIANWKTDARLEDMERYFHVTSDVKALFDGQKNYVIGRKGTGKTAIAAFIESRVAYKTFVKRLSLKNFPFESLYHLFDSKFTPPNQYITLWKYVIYSTLIYMMSDNENINPALSKNIRSVRVYDPSAALSKTTGQWTSASFDFGLAGIKVSGSLTNQAKNLDWMQRIEILELAVEQYIDDSDYYILFDELDEDYKYNSVLNANPRYLELITGLFKATQDVVRELFQTAARVKPIVFLRDDIFDMVRDPDKTKWLDLTLRLRWTSLAISPLLAFRIMRARDPKAEQLPFDDAWSAIVDSTPIRHDEKKPIEAYDWISRRTMLRPRDYIKYIQLCADHATKATSRRIRPNVIATQSGAFSQYLRSELTDEIHSILPDISEIFDLLSFIGKQNFSTTEFVGTYNEKSWIGKSEDLTAEQVLQVLHYFSAIGAVRGTGALVFKYSDPGANFDPRQGNLIHRGLYKALQLF